VIAPPFSVQDFLDAAQEAFQLPENAPQERSKPRASAISGCARENAYMMTNTPKSNDNALDPSRQDMVLTTEQGRMYEDISVKVIEEMGLAVVDRQLSLPDDYPVTGHPDGRLEFPPQFSFDPHEKVWGFEHKHFGRYQYQQIYKRGLESAAPEILVQTSLYGDALGWDNCVVVIVGQDASSNRGDATSNLRVKNPSSRWVRDDWHPKVQIYGVDVKAIGRTLLPRVKSRAQWLSDWKTKALAPSTVMREYNPDPDEQGKVQFPCSYCEWRDVCREDGAGGDPAPALPFKV